MYICTLYTFTICRIAPSHLAVRIESISAQRDAAQHSLAGQCEPNYGAMLHANCLLCSV